MQPLNFFTPNSKVMDAKLAKIYHSPGGYWKGIAAIKKLAEAAKVPEETAKRWLIKHALWRIFLPALRQIPRPKFDVPTPNKVHQVDLLFLPHNKLRVQSFQICTHCCQRGQPLQRGRTLVFEKF